MPAYVAIGLIVFYIDESGNAPARRTSRSPLNWHAMHEFPPGYWLIVGVGATFTLAGFSDAFLAFRAQQTGIDVA